jgi:hypothetical protein
MTKYGHDDSLHLKSIKKKKKQGTGSNSTMKGLSSQMNLNSVRPNLRDNYRQEKKDSSDEFSLVDIDDVIGEAA